MGNPNYANPSSFEEMENQDGTTQSVEPENDGNSGTPPTVETNETTE